MSKDDECSVEVMRALGNFTQSESSRRVLIQQKGWCRFRLFSNRPFSLNLIRVDITRELITAARELLELNKNEVKLKKKNHRKCLLGWISS